MFKKLNMIYFLLFAVMQCSGFRVARQAEITTTEASISDEKPEIYSLHVKSEVFSRFATTLVTSRLANLDESAREAIFVVQLPDAAFISNFSMEIDNEIIVGEVKEKEKAKQEYDAAKAAGQSTGLVAQAPRETNTFHISVNVEAQGKVTFNLTYQEILQRVHGVYKHIVNIQPGQVVNDLQVEVAITEEKEITTLVVPEFGEKVGEKANQDIMKLPKAKDVLIKEVITPELSRVEISYMPKTQKQKELQKEGTKGLAGQLVVLYDIKRGPSGGDIKVINGYFIHFFAPSNIPVADKHALFVLDTSGSMSGRKIEQTQAAMRVILKDLNEGDSFNIIEFDSDVRQWKNESVLASTDNIEEATIFVNSLEADGGTNIDDALQVGLKKLLDKTAPQSINPVLIFLTDGEATIGETGTDKIINNVKGTNIEELVSIQSIGFGSGADFSLLKRLSLENHGLARKVYEDSDAALQLQGFYAEISSLLLRDVDIKYLNETVEPDSVVQDNDYNYYNGSEFLVVGKLREPETKDEKKVPPTLKLEAAVSGQSALGEQHFLSSVPNLPSCHPVIQSCPEPVEACPFDAPCPKPRLCRLEPVWTCDEVLASPHSIIDPYSIGGFVERMWAYLSIKKMLERAKYDPKVNSTELKDEALQLSLKYNFVTELTSMVVVQPDQNETQSLGEEPTKDDLFQDISGGTASGGSGRSSRRFSAKGGGRFSAAAPPPPAPLDLSKVHGIAGPPAPIGALPPPRADLSAAPLPQPQPQPQPQPIPIPAPAPAAQAPPEPNKVNKPKPKPIQTETKKKEKAERAEEEKEEEPPFEIEADDETEELLIGIAPLPVTKCKFNETNFPDEAEGCETSCGAAVIASKICNFPRFCRCHKGYRRAANGDCLLAFDCPPMIAVICNDPNAEFAPCGLNCGHKKCLEVDTPCDKCGAHACVCKNGFKIGPQNVCIKESDC